MAHPPLSRARGPQLWSSCGTQPSHRLVPCQRQEAGKSRACLRDTGEGWTPGAGARPGSVITLCGKEPAGELCSVTVTVHCLEGCGGKGVRKSPGRQERALSWESGNLALGKLLPPTHCVTCISPFPSLWPLVFPSAKLEIHMELPVSHPVLGSTLEDKAKSPLPWSFHSTSQQAST